MDRHSCLQIRHTYFSLTIGKELVWIHAIADGTPDDWHPIEDNRGLIGIFEENLLQYSPENRYEYQGS